MKTSITRIIVLAFATLATAVYSQAQYDASLETIFKSLIAKDYALLRPVSEKRVEVIWEAENSRERLNIVETLKLLPVPESFRVIGSRNIGQNRLIKVEYQYPGKAMHHHFLFNPNGKLLRLTVIGEKRASRNRPEPDTAFSESL